MCLRLSRPSTFHRDTKLLESLNCFKIGGNLFFLCITKWEKLIMKKKSIIIKLNVLIKDQIEQFSILLVERKILRIIEMRYTSNLLTKTYCH